MHHAAPGQGGGSGGGAVAPKGSRRILAGHRGVRGRAIAESIRAAADR
eukprot:COSAG06_NODE_3900_length_4791_cov_13.290068_3_plen_48_part_00